MKKAFTIVELLVVMAIIGILLTLAVVGIQQLQKQQMEVLIGFLKQELPITIFNLYIL